MEVKFPSHYQHFCSRLKNDQSSEGARAEAIVFSFLRSSFRTVKIAEDISSGGVDFHCISNQVEFVVEVTCLGTEAVANQSGIKNSIPKGGSAGSFGMITRMLRTRVSGKTNQLSGYQIPRILAITTEHRCGDFLLGPQAAETLLTSDTQVTVPLNNSLDNDYLSSDLKNSVFFKFDNNGRVELCRRSISCLLFANINADRVELVGILHPDPKFNFPINLFPSIPFLRIKKWPLQNNEIETEWIIHSPESESFFHHVVKLHDEELRNI